MTECIACQAFTMRKDKDMAVLGFGNCRHDPDWRYHSATRGHECKTFSAEDAAAVEQRRQWLQKAQCARKAGSSE